MSDARPSSSVNPEDRDVTRRASELFSEQLLGVYQRTDKMFAVLMGLQWLAGMIAAFWISPRAWSGDKSQIHPHVWAAIFLGCVTSAFPLYLIATSRGAALTRQVVAIAQMSWSVLLIHISGGRIDTHFHVFGSLAFLAFYRDWRVIVTASLVIAADHLLRGALWPESVFGVSVSDLWRPMEHAGWVVFEDIFLWISIRQGLDEMRAICIRQANLEQAQETTEEQVHIRTAELRTAKAKLRAMSDSSPLGMFVCDAQGAFEQVNRMYEVISGLPFEQILGWGWTSAIHPADADRVLHHWRKAILSGSDFRSLHRFQHPNGTVIWTSVVAGPMHEGDLLTGFVGAVEDVTEQHRLEMQLRQAQKMESIGQLAAGIAHEINTPIQYVSDNNRFLRDCFANLECLLREYDQVLGAAKSDALSEKLLAEASRARDSADLEYLTAEIPLAIDQSLEGLERVASIVRAMKEFSHPGADEKIPTDLNHCIESTLTVARNEWKYVADLQFDPDPRLPLVPCYPNDFNQVVLNLVVNAAHAIADAPKSEPAVKGNISVSTHLDDDCAELRIADTGTGIPENIRSRVFDPFFTTKIVGRGTGQGLSLAYSVIVDKLGGSIHFSSEVGQGTTFVVRLPLGSEAPLATSAATSSPP